MINLITGSTGFLGENLVKKLLDKKEEVWVLVRGEDYIKKVREKFPQNFQKIKIFQADILKDGLGLSKMDFDILKKEKITLWHLAANLSFATKEKENVWNTNFNGTKNVVKFANKIGVEKLIYVSTVYVSGDYQGVIFEDELVLGQKFRNNYEASKYQAEKYVREKFENKILILRPSVILGEVYSGKAVGCTFGYYRFVYMFYLFKKWMIKKLQSKSKFSFWKFILKIFGTKYDKKKDEIKTPWLWMLYVVGGKVDLVSVDFVVNSMMKINALQKNKIETVHLTSEKPADPKFLMKLIFESLGYKKTKHFYVSKIFFLSLIRVFYILTFPIKNYTKSIYWYLPYFIRKYNFNHKNFKKYNLKSTEINEEYMRKVNEYAKKEIFDKVINPKL